MTRLLCLITLIAAAACRSAAPGTEVPGQPAIEQRGRAADIAFMRGMIAHHAQALDMARLAPARANRGNIRLLAERIDASQLSEIARMRQWLELRGEAVSDSAIHHDHAGELALMPGMITREEMERLAAARGPDFDRLFLEFMIRHHEGALVMVRDLMDSGGGLDPGVYVLASDIDADQRGEIARMRKLLETLQRGSE